MFNPPGTNAFPAQYLELRGTPNLLLTNTYFVAVEGDTNGNVGTIQDVFDLSGLRIGGNGFLVLLQHSNSYRVNPASTALVNTNGPGFGSGGSSGVRHRGESGQVGFESASCTFFLVEASHSPNVGVDIDNDNDGVPDTPAFAEWTILDSVGVLDNNGGGDVAYGQVNFRRQRAPGNDATVRTGVVIPIDFTPGYVARLGNSTNFTADDWIAADKLGGTALSWILPAGSVYPTTLANQRLSSVGAPNLRGTPLPGVVVRPQRGGINLGEGRGVGRYTIALNTRPLRPVSVMITAPVGLIVSVDGGRSFGLSRTLLVSTLPRTVLVRTLDDNAAGPQQRTLAITHQLTATGDPEHYPLDSIIIPPVAVTVTDNEHVLLSEVKSNPPGDDAPFEFVELRGTPNAALTNVQLVSVVGDAEANPGTVSNVVNLSSSRLGPNGLLVVLATNSPYVPAPATTVIYTPALSTAGGGLPNGTVSFLLVHSTNAISEGTDLDAGDNGVAEKLPADAVVLDSIAWRRNGNGSDRTYTDAVLAMDSGTPDAATRFPKDDRANTAAAWFGGNLFGDTGESLIYDEEHVTTNFPSRTALSPGVTNNTAPFVSALPAFSSVIGDPTTPSIAFTIRDAESPVAGLRVTISSSNTNVVDASGLVLRGTGASRTLSIRPHGVGYSTITVFVSDGAVTGWRSFPYAAAADERGRGRFHTGASDGSTAYAVDNQWMIVGDDENQILRLYSRSNSGPAIATFDISPSLELTDIYPDGRPKEVDIEASTHVGNRIFWMGSHSHTGDAELTTNRARIFATDITGVGTNVSLKAVGFYQYFKSDVLAWDSHGVHGKGDFYYGLLDSSQPGVDPKDTNGLGFNIEGLAMAPFSTNMAYVGFRAPLVPPTNRAYALIVPVSNFTALASQHLGPGSTAFGAPIELNLGGRGIRSIEGLGTNYLIVAGPPGPATGVPPSDFKLYTWTGRPEDQPQERSTDLTGMNPEGIVALPRLPWTSNSVVQLLSDNGATVLYGDGVQAKHLPLRQFKQCRTDWVRLGQAVTPRPLIRKALAKSDLVEITWHSVAGVTYRIQGTASLAQSVWRDLSPDITAGSATTTFGVRPEECSFFRVIVVNGGPNKE